MGQIQDLQVLLTGLRRFAQRDTRRAAPFLLPALQFLASARAQKMNSFLQAADTLQKFWR
jgi:hypothetical protein